MLDPERRYYVYVWYTLDTNEIFYVGKGTGNRYKTRKRENSFFMNILNSHECDSKVIIDNLTEQEAYETEIFYIKYYRKYSRILTNVSDGGDAPPKLYGKRPKEWVENMKKAQRRFYEEHPEYKVRASERMKVFFKTPEGKAFQRKSIESRNNEEFRKNQSVKCKAANRTQEYRERHSKLMKEIYSSEELRDKERGSKNPRAQGIKQFNLDGIFIKEYETITQASKETGVGIARISDVARGNRKTAGGYIWKFSNDKHIHHKKKAIYNIENDKCLKLILQYTKNGEFVAEYKGIAEATRINEFKNRTNIISNLKGRTKSAYGFIWKYK